MTEPPSNSPVPSGPSPALGTALAAAAGGVAGGLVVALVLMLGGGQQAREPVEPVAQSDTPVMDYLDAFRCPPGFSRRVVVLGTEDGFARAGDEPARIAPALRDRPFYQELVSGTPLLSELRNYDEGRSDRLLIDHFVIPGQTVSGTFVIRHRGVGNSATNDYINLVPVEGSPDRPRAPGLGYNLSFSNTVWETVGAEGSGVQSAPLEAFLAMEGTSFQTLLDELAARPRDTEIHIAVQDDTVVDVMGFGLCLEPDEPRGVTLAEHSAKPAGPDISILACSIDDNQRMCGPFQGDTPCTQAMPLACYRPGNQSRPLDTALLGTVASYFVPGEVRLTEPVRGDSLETREEANQLCVDRFGAGFRVLRYQEGGGGTVVSRSRIPAGVRAWIEIGDQPRATCWNRPARGEIPPRE